MQGCYICGRNAAGEGLRGWERVYLDDYWRLTLAFDTSLPGWLVLVPRRHVEGLDQLTEDEAEGLGRVLRASSAALVEVTGCLRTYVMLFAEKAEFAHLHLHVVPRHAELPEEHRGPGVFAYLGVATEQQLSDHEREELTTRLRCALRS